PFKGLTHIPEEIIEDVQASTFTAFDQLVRTAIAKQVDFVLLVGDVFDQGENRMITYVKGLLTEINDQSIVVEVQGLGYEIICGNPYEFQHEENGEVHVHTYQHVREDAIQLYGFKHPKQKTLFMKLISVSGIGPKSGIAIIGT